MDQFVRLTHVRTCPSQSVYSSILPIQKGLTFRVRMKNPGTPLNSRPSCLHPKVTNLHLKDYYYYVTVLPIWSAAQDNFANLELKRLDFKYTRLSKSNPAVGLQVLVMFAYDYYCIQIVSLHSCLCCERCVGYLVVGGGVIQNDDKLYEPVLSLCASSLAPQRILP